jgi:hypothetical protein
MMFAKPGIKLESVRIDSDCENRPSTTLRPKEMTLTNARRCLRNATCATLLITACLQQESVGWQQPTQTESPQAETPATETPAASIEIAKEPRSIDPATVVPEPLAAKSTVRLTDRSLVEVAQWVQEASGMDVDLDRPSLAEARILVSELVNDELSEAPIYLLLDRLRTIGVGWLVSDGTLRLVSAKDAAETLSTAQYNVGDLFDRNYLAESLVETVVSTVDPNSWDDNGGAGGIVVLGDVLFVRQSYQNHRRVAGLLAALRTHGEFTLIDDAPVHSELRQSLNRIISVQFSDKPLAETVAELRELTGADIRLDALTLKNASIPLRLPITFSSDERPLGECLNQMLATHEMTWHIRDGVIWITTHRDAVNYSTTAVFDVRDLCRNDDESYALMDAIEGQAAPESWDDVEVAIAFPVAGTMVVRQTEARLQEVHKLLENYRTALRASKRRVRPEEDPQAMLTQYYRMPSNVADDLVRFLPQLLKPNTWQSNNQAAQGTILKIQSWSEPSVAQAKPELAGSQIPYAVLVIYQSREVHNELPTLLQRIQHGDQPASAMGGMGGMGGGGFGGGYFSVPTP